MLADLCIIKERTSGLGGDLYSPSALSSLIVDFVAFLTSPSLTRIILFHSGILKLILYFGFVYLDSP